MGLAVLPARLKRELEEVERFILGKTAVVADYHMSWAEELKSRYRSVVDVANVESIVREEVGKKFLRVLEDAGVFKRNDEGTSGFKRFIEALS